MVNSTIEMKEKFPIIKEVTKEEKSRLFKLVERDKTIMAKIIDNHNEEMQDSQKYRACFSQLDKNPKLLMDWSITQGRGWNIKNKKTSHEDGVPEKGEDSKRTKALKRLYYEYNNEKFFYKAKKLEAMA